MGNNKNKTMRCCRHRAAALNAVVDHVTPKLRDLILRCLRATHALHHHRSRSLGVVLPPRAAAAATAATEAMGQTAGLPGRAGDEADSEQVLGGGGGCRAGARADSSKHSGEACAGPTAGGGGPAGAVGGDIGHATSTQHTPGWNDGWLQMAAELWEDEEEWGFFGAEFDGETQVGCGRRPPQPKK
jgi:hypothetical protein